MDYANADVSTLGTVALLVGAVSAQCTQRRASQFIRTPPAGKASRASTFYATTISQAHVRTLAATFFPWCKPAAVKQFLSMARVLFSLDLPLMSTTYNP
jgi:hypothetical protein